MQNEQFSHEGAAAVETPVESLHHTVRIHIDRNEY